VCPPDIDLLFQHRFQIARGVYDLRSEVRNLDGQIDNLERRLRDLHHGEERRLKEAGSDEQRKKLRQAIDDERRHLRGDISEADRRLRRKRDELRSAEFALCNLR
jgi:chromosome segregation ATPase